MTTLLTHKTSTCTDNYSLFGKDKTFYALPTVVKSRTSIHTDVSSLLEKARSFGELSHEVSIVTTRSSLGVVENRPTAQQGSQLSLPPTVVIDGRLVDDELEDYHELEDYDDDIPGAYNLGTSDAASFVTARSDNANEDPVLAPGNIYTLEKNPHVFHRWMKTMFKKTTKEGRLDQNDDRVHSRDGSMISGFKTMGSSSRFVTAVKTASVTLASYPMSANTSAPRNSTCGAPLDKDTIERMLDRKHALEELITTEEYYIRDLKSLKDQYLPILRDCVWISADVRQAMARNVTEMVDLHSRLLSEITRVLPCTTQMMQGNKLDASPRIGGMERYPILADPSAAAEVAKAFETTIMAFFVYEEYSAKYQEVLKAPRRGGKDAELGHGRGAEALIGASNSWDNRGDYGKRAMELHDMLFKPIQRLCKYPLLFRDIEKHTPAIDCPDTNRLLEKVRHRLDEQVHQVNAANNDAPKARERIEKTWLLQDRLDFQKTDLPVRLLGHIILAGTVHITWQSKRDSQPHTEYMACLLFKSYLILASVQKPDHYKVRFAITLAVARMEEPSHGKGLYSPGAPHTWKIVFEAEHRIYEVLCSACNDEEENIWRTHIQDRISAESKDYQEYSSTNVDFCACISNDIRPVGDVFGRPGTLARHQSLHLGGAQSPLESDGRYILINNMLSASDPSGVESSNKQSSSALNFHGMVPTVNLKRADRNRAEARLADVWTRDLIPFGATQTKTKENNSTMIRRRISMLNILSSHPKKSATHGNLMEYSESHEEYDNEGVPWSGAVSRSSTKSSRKSKSSNKSVPSNPTKRSSSLSSRFSFRSSGKKENTAERPPISIDAAATAVAKKRSLRPILDVNKWRSSTSSFCHQSTLVEGRESSDMLSNGRWSAPDARHLYKIDDVRRPNSVEDVLDICGALRDDFVQSRAASETGIGENLSPDWRARERPILTRRHTAVTPEHIQKRWKKSHQSKRSSKKADLVALNPSVKPGKYSTPAGVLAA